jgi:hypothetical protein
MRATIFTMAMLTACTFDATWFGTDADSDTDSSSGSTEFMPDEKRPTPESGSTSDSASSTGAEIESDGSSSDDTTSSSGGESTGDAGLPPVTYQPCVHNTDCGGDPSDLCLAGVCSRHCITDADCRPTPEGFTGPPYCPPNVLLCLMPCLTAADCLPGQQCRELGQDDIMFCAA